ncbi:HAD family hydrolase [Terrabacter sp. NPDC080008]|uniref:HAD family hydrolase n=1 Tax=Terrabacter sp. NPDC080008 TaxID=3155176 RepID=UPI00344DF056
MIDTVILDVDGTLVDSNYHHTLAWARAFGEKDLHPPLWRVHRAIGMGGDKLVGHVAGDDVEKESGDELRDLWSEQFDRIIGEVTAFEGTRALLEAVKGQDRRLVLASSGQPQHIKTFLDLFDGTSIADAWTTSEDVEESKPAADLLDVALERVGGTRGVMVGDSIWDARAAKAAGIPSIGLRTGGFSEAELREAGAVEVFDGPEALGEAIASGLLDRLTE